ncbi:MAG: family 20 glycosylhydrolase, partial [Bacteroidales bacterium]|nr:family 20 glycosylhydrolase [Bacteroidales bacterium]
MKTFFNSLLAAALLAVLVSCGGKSDPNLNIVLVPNPVSMETGGRGVELAAPGMVREIRTVIDASLAPEAYILDTRRGKVVITGGSEAGVFWGRQSLRQILAQTEAAGSHRIPGLLIKDEPAFAYRGAHLDCCRHFFPVEEVKEYIDMLALHKINVFHWHLTDDQGWRAEIKRYPRLTEIGSKRAETLVGHYGSKEYDGTPYGGFYTQDQMREIVAYAAERFITVIPEIEMPGHASAALASYPELGCRGANYPYKVQTTWGVFPEVFCAGNPETVTFLEGVLDEICDIFPSEYIHIG